ncbi:hypothetical protein DB354_11510 [Opitutus sp. ER46]|nr:hypothetical protein DB354_11510 [Opitutus sp. ER46]
MIRKWGSNGSIANRAAHHAMGISEFVEFGGDAAPALRQTAAADAGEVVGGASLSLPGLLARN